MPPVVSSLSQVDLELLMKSRVCDPESCNKDNNEKLKYEDKI